MGKYCETEGVQRGWRLVSMRETENLLRCSTQHPLGTAMRKILLSGWQNVTAELLRKMAQEVDPKTLVMCSKTDSSRTLPTIGDVLEGFFRAGVHARVESGVSKLGTASVTNWVRGAPLLQSDCAAMMKAAVAFTWNGKPFFKKAEVLNLSDRDNPSWHFTPEGYSFYLKQTQQLFGVPVVYNQPTKPSDNLANVLPLFSRAGPRRRKIG